MRDLHADALVLYMTNKKVSVLDISLFNKLIILKKYLHGRCHDTKHQQVASS